MAKRGVIFKKKKSNTTLKLIRPVVSQRVLILPDRALNKRTRSSGTSYIFRVKSRSGRLLLA